MICGTDLDYFETLNAKAKCYECKSCCNLKYCIQGKLNADWLKRITSDDKMRVRKGKDLRVRAQPEKRPRFKLSLAAL